MGNAFEGEPMTTALEVPTGRKWTIEDVASLPEDFHYELLDGRLIVPPAPMPIHQSICADMVFALRANCPEDVLVTFDQSVMVDNHSEPRPDVVAVRVEGASRTPVFGSDVLLVVEVVSRSPTVTDREEKKKLYAYGRIPAYWIIDPLAERVTFTRFLLGPDHAYRQQVETSEAITLADPWPARLDLPAWTRHRDRLREAARPDR